MIQTRSAQRSQTLSSTSLRRRRSTSEKSLLRQSGTQCLCSLSLSIPREPAHVLRHRLYFGLCRGQLAAEALTTISLTSLLGARELASFATCSHQLLWCTCQCCC